MAKVSVSTMVPASPDETWATASDLSRLGEWLVLHEGWRGEIPHDIQAGSELTSVVAVKGLRNRITWLVDVYDPPHELAISGKGVGGTRVSLTLTVQPSGQTSTVTVDAEITGPTTIGPVGMLIGRALKGDMRRSVTRLTDLLS